MESRARRARVRVARGRRARGRRVSQAARRAHLPQINSLGEPADELRHLHRVVRRPELPHQLLAARTNGAHPTWSSRGTTCRASCTRCLPRLYRATTAARPHERHRRRRAHRLRPAHRAAASFTVGRPFPTTLYNWRLQVALTVGARARAARRAAAPSRDLHGRASCVVVIAGMAIVVIVAAERERRLAALKSDFVANVSHELKTPLSLVRMFGEMLAQRARRERREAPRVPANHRQRERAAHGAHRERARLRQGRARQSGATSSPRATSGRPSRARSTCTATAPSARGSTSRSPLDPRLPVGDVRRARARARGHEPARQRAQVREGRQARRPSTCAQAGAVARDSRERSRARASPASERRRIFERFVRGSAGGREAGARQRHRPRAGQAHRREPRRQSLGRVRGRRRQHVRRHHSRAGFAGSREPPSGSRFWLVHYSSVPSS